MRHPCPERVGPVCHKASGEVGLWHVRALEAALCATGTKRMWPCVPQEQNGLSLVCHGAKAGSALCASGAERSWACLPHGCLAWVELAVAVAGFVDLGRTGRR